MKRFTTNGEIEILCEAMIKDFFKSKRYTKMLCVDIEAFVTEYLGIPIVYETFAEPDPGRIGFLSDGKRPLWVARDSIKQQVVFPPNTVVLDKFLLNAKERARKRFTIAYILLSLDCLHKAGVRFFLRGFGRIAGFPLAEQMVVVGQDAKGMVSVRPKFLRFGFLPDIGPSQGCLAVIDQAKILGQFFGGFFGGQIVEPGSEVDHIPIRTAAETVETGIHFHAGIFVVVKGTAGHPVPSDFNPIKLDRFSGTDRLLDYFKKIPAHA